MLMALCGGWVLRGGKYIYYTHIFSDFFNKSCHFCPLSLFSYQRWIEKGACNQQKRIWWFSLLMKWGGHRFDSRKDQLRKGLEWPWVYLFMVSQSNPSALEQNWLHDSQSCVASQVRSCGWENGTSLKDISPLGLVVLFHGQTYTPMDLHKMRIIQKCYYSSA